MVHRHLKFECCGLYGFEVDGAGLSLAHRIAVGLLYRLPLASFIPIVDLPTVGHAASAPRLVVEPVYGTALHGGLLGEGV